MNINLHIERLILDGVPLAPNQRPALQAAVAAELTRLLERDGLQDRLSGGTFYRLPIAEIEMADKASATQLGGSISGAVYGAISK